MKIVKYLLGGLIAVLVLTAFAPLAAPTRPSLVSPINKAVKVDPGAVVLKWSRSTTTLPATIVDYDVEVSDSSAVLSNGAFVSTVDTGTVAPPSALEFTVAGGALDYGRTYYWHVRANDSAASSTWSTVGVFRVGVQPPTLVPLAPGDLLTLRPTFKWTPGLQNADSYTIQLSMDPGFSVIYRQATISSSAIPANQYLLTSDLAPNIALHWRVRANNSLLGTSGWSAFGSFISPNPPSIPVLVSPNNVSVSATPLLTWKPVSIQSIETWGTYMVEIFDTKQVTTTAPVFTADEVTEPSLGNQFGIPSTANRTYRVPASANLAPATTYYWRIKAFNGDGEYSTSSLFIFYTTIVGEIDAAKLDPGETLGNVPGLEGPGAGTTKTISPVFTGTVRENANLLSLRPVFKWGLVPFNADTLTIQVASYVSGNCNLANPEDSKFLSTIINVNVPFSETEYAANLDKYPNYILCWRIRGNHSLYGSSDWSDVQIFKTANPPSIPELVGPVDGTLTNDESPRLVWNKVNLPGGTTFAKYEVEISYNSNFKGYEYPDDTIPPYGGEVDPLSYPLPYPILPDNLVGDPVYAVVRPKPLFPNFPMIDQAHDPITDQTNRREESWYDVEPEVVAGPPPGNPFYNAHTYYWRVRSYNSAGEYSAWSIVRSIRITVDRPTGLTLTDCKGNVTPDAVIPRPCFDWDDVYRAVSYKIVIYDKVKKTTILSAAATTSQYQPKVDLPKDRELTWTVYANGGSLYGVSLAALPQSFQSANPPSTPTPVAPIGNKLVMPTAVEPTPVFSWTKSITPFGPAAFNYYELEIALDTNFTVLATPVIQTALGDPNENFHAIAAGVLNPAMTYYWRVRACNDAVPVQCSTWSATSTFRMVIGTPTLISPPDTAAPATTLRPVFRWNPVNDATSYNILISKNPACVSPGISATVNFPTTGYQPAYNLTAGTPYYWCVRANNRTYGPGPWSAPDMYTP